MGAFPVTDLPALFLDAASPTVCAGLQVSATEPIVWRCVQEEAGVGIFGATDSLLRESRLRVDDVRSFVFCDGPGSLLGIRLVAMTLRTWMNLPRGQTARVWRYRSLALVAADLIDGGQHGPLCVLNDARRETWNVLAVDGTGAIGDIERRATTELAPITDARPCFIPENFPHWQPLPAGVRRAPYRPERLPELATRFPLLAATEAPDAFMTEMPTYRTWTPAAAANPQNPGSPQ